MRILHRLSFSLLVLAAAGSVHASTFRVGTGRGCTHGSVQAAVDAAAATPSFDIIHVTRTKVYAEQQIRIDNQDLALIGGFVDCLADANGGDKTVLSGAGRDPASVVSVSGRSEVGLIMLELQNGDIEGLPDENYALGGGLSIKGRSWVFLEDVTIANNNASTGGGIGIRSDVEEGATLIIGPNTLIASNNADNGGGLSCTGANTVLMLDGPSAIWGNRAGSGGGISAGRGCRVDIASGGTAFPTISSNAATDSGGGISAWGEGTVVRLFTGDEKWPVRVAGNHAENRGGGISVGHGAAVLAWNAIIDLNNAREGAGVNLRGYGKSGRSVFAMLPAGRAAEGFGAAPDAMRCDAAKRCNRISDNGSVQRTSGAGALHMDVPEGGAQASLDTVLVTNNRGGYIIRAANQDDNRDGGSSLRLGNVLLAQNTAMREAMLYLGNNADARIEHSTIAGNSSAAETVMVRLKAESRLEVRGSLLHQPGMRVILADQPLFAQDWRFVMAHEVVNLPVSSTVVADDPQFVDRAGGDFRLGPESPALDFQFADPARPLDLDLRPRSNDLPEVSNFWGSMDLGAYER